MFLFCVLKLRVMLGWGKHVAACCWWVVIKEFHWLSHRWEALYAHICHMANNEHKDWESFLLWIFISEKNQILRVHQIWEQIPIEISVWSLCSFVLKYFLAACESRGLVIRSKWPKWMSKDVKFHLDVNLLVRIRLCFWQCSKYVCPPLKPPTVIQSGKSS